MKEFFAENGIKKYETSSKKKAAVAERAIRTLKTRLYKYFSAKNTSAWVDVLPKFLSAINNSVCRATGLRPNDISDANAREVWKRVYGEGLVPMEERPKIKAGETVRIPEPKHIFEKGISNSSAADCANVAYVSSLIGTRAAHLCACGLAAILNRMQRPRVTIGVDGSVFRFHPTFKFNLTRRSRRCWLSNANSSWCSARTAVDEAQQSQQRSHCG
ncbi:hypothetical protein niasHT_028370 [Heterodera trifolii]|uniref:Hexokinase C-terminal domain-containing protein n=1 Tax=Heterodera trifolii TaxID=157864 RepID=A0ABD2JIY1_9BILA